MSKIFQCQRPILEACMNKGSTLKLALAVHEAGGYPSLCSWTYNKRAELLQKDLDLFVKTTGSNRIHISFELGEFDPQIIIDIVKSHRVPTIELIYGDKNTFGSTTNDHDVIDQLEELLQPIKALGTRVFRRIYDPVDHSSMNSHLLDGFCIKGKESAGFSGYMSVRDLFLKQQQLTPSALLIPYGGVGTAAQVKDYMDLGAEIVAVGTLLALSAESSLSTQTKQQAITARSDNLTEFKHVVGNTERKQTALQFQPYIGPDDQNGTIGLVRGIHGKTHGHVYFGHGIDHVSDILTCKQIISNLTSQIL